MVDAHDRTGTEEPQQQRGERSGEGWPHASRVDKETCQNRQKDKDARWTKKHGKNFYGYKNHINADARHKLIRRYGVSDASVHDSRTLDGLLSKSNTSVEVYATAPIARPRPRRG